jgi:hypothetical protein
MEKLRFENLEGLSPEVDESHRFKGGHTTPDLELQRKVESENAKVPKEILIIDQEGSRRFVDLVERDEVPKRTRVVYLVGHVLLDCELQIIVTPRFVWSCVSEFPEAPKPEAFRTIDSRGKMWIVDL